MNNCNVSIYTGVSKAGKTYYCLIFKLQDKIFARQFIKETEIDYYKKLLNLKD